MPSDRALIPDPDALIGRLRPARWSDAPALLALKRQAYGKYVPRIDAEPQRWWQTTP